MFKNILFPVDFSERCERFAPQVAVVARELEARVTLLHVLVPACDAYTVPEVAVFVSVDEMRTLRASADEQLRQLVRDHFAGVDTDVALMEGFPNERILAYALQHGTDLIMMPTHGRGAFKRALLGSVTTEVLKYSNVPVWTDTHQEQPAPTVARRPEVVLAAADDSEQCVAVVETAEKLSRCFAAKFAVVHAEAKEPLLTATYAGAAAPVAVWGEALAKIEQLERTAGLKAEIHVVDGSVTAALADEAARNRADLLVVGRGHLQRPFGSFLSHLGEIIRRSPCAVLSV